MGKTDLYSSSSKDTGCPRLAAMLGYPVECLECPLPERCLYEMGEPEIKDLEECLRTQRCTVSAYLVDKREGSG